jgi:hypothetical protein
LAVIIQAALKFDVEKFNLRKINELEVMKHYHIEITNKSAVLENLNDSEDINMAWENFRENTKSSARETVVPYKLKQHKP